MVHRTLAERVSGAFTRISPKGAGGPSLAEEQALSRVCSKGAPRAFRKR
jgi:hypothetical protein